MTSRPFTSLSVVLAFAAAAGNPVAHAADPQLDSAAGEPSGLSSPCALIGDAALRDRLRVPESVEIRRIDLSQLSDSYKGPPSCTFSWKHPNGDKGKTPKHVTLIVHAHDSNGEALERLESARMVRAKMAPEFHWTRVEDLDVPAYRSRESLIFVHRKLRIILGTDDDKDAVAVAKAITSGEQVRDPGARRGICGRVWADVS